LRQVVDFTEKRIFVYDSLLWKLESYVSLIMYVEHNGLILVLLTYVVQIIFGEERISV